MIKIKMDGSIHATGKDANDIFNALKSAYQVEDSFISSIKIGDSIIPPKNCVKAFTGKNAYEIVNIRKTYVVVFDDNNIQRAVEFFNITNTFSVDKWQLINSNANVENVVKEKIL